MMKVELYQQDHQLMGELELREEIFAQPYRKMLVYQVLKAQLANRRQGTACTKTKAQVRGGGKKPYRQKGTGRARQGSRRSPICVGGGVAFGPKPRSYEVRTPKKMVRGAICSMLSERLREKKLVCLDQITFSEIKTKTLYQWWKKYWKETESLLILDQENLQGVYSARNIPRIKWLSVEQINLHALVRFPWVVLTKRAINWLQQTYVGGSSS